MFNATRVRRLVLAAGAGLVLATGPLVAAPAYASGYPTAAACHQAGDAGVRAGDWPYYACVPHRGGGWDLLPG
ncbi:MAG: hypothetical protein V7603_3382 [Micromonosporaceae bacterium]